MARADKNEVRLVALLGVIAAFQVWWFQRNADRAAAGAVASSVAGQAVSVRCPSIWRRLIDVSSLGDSAHYDTEGRPSYAQLAHEVCATFDELDANGFSGVGCLATAWTSREEHALDVVFAVHVLTNESWHLGGVTDEGTAECYAYQTDSEVAQRFGATRGQGEILGRFVELRGSAAALPQYRPPAGCTRGGRLDIHRETPTWPS